MSTLESSQEQPLSPDKLARLAKNAQARELLRAKREANTVARKCLGCNEEFRSEGAHNRLCSRCRSRT